MMRSLFAGVSGLKNHQTRMDVIGNNIANVNTTGFKAGRVNFQDIFSQTLQGASSPTGARGGTNPMQVGMGMGLASIDTIFTDGSFQPTGKQTDLAISGSGFFVLDNGQTKMYTRAGAFDFDAEGNYILPGTGYKVVGWTANADGVINNSQEPSGIKIPIGATMPSQVTTTTNYTGNLSASLPAVGDSTVAVTDAGAAVTKTDDLVAAFGTTAIITSANNALNAANLEYTSANVAYGDAMAAANVLGATANDVLLAVQGSTPASAKATAAAITAEALSGSTAASVAAAVLGVLNDATTLKNAAQSAKDAIDASNTAALAAQQAAVAADNAVAAAYSNPPTGTEKDAVSAAAKAAEAAKKAEDTAQAALVAAQAVNAAGGTNPVFNFVAAATNVKNAATQAVTDVKKAAESVTSAANKGSVAPMTVTVYDVQGNAYKLAGTFQKVNDNTWTFTPNGTVVDEKGITVASVSPPGGGPLTPSTIRFNPDGTYSSLSIINDLRIDPAGGPYSGAGAFTITPDFSAMTQYGAKESSINAYRGDGYAAGTLDRVIIDPSGVIIGIFTNGMNQNLAQVAMAVFNNPGGLTKVGESMFIPSNNSGEPQIGTSETGGRGKFQGATLEMSNVDLAQEFTNMIITQRGFQANSKIITTSDEMLQELANLKR